MVTLSVYLDGPFWVGVLELVEDGELRATRFTLGAEPTDPELYDYLNARRLAGARRGQRLAGPARVRHRDDRGVPGRAPRPRGAQLELGPRPRRGPGRPVRRRGRHLSPRRHRARPRRVGRAGARHDRSPAISI
ncbi:DUF2992 family protein [Nonomuraea sp. NEAU-A123]|nr:DUF2992 family protein [Nonomuraea sp. NEAU-A123]